MKNVIFYLLLLILVYTIWRFVMFYYKNPFSRSLDILPFLVCWHLLFSRTRYLNCFNFCLSINLWLLLKFLLAYIPICTWILSYWGCYASNISSAAFSIFFLKDRQQYNGPVRTGTMIGFSSLWHQPQKRLLKMLPCLKRIYFFSPNWYKHCSPSCYSVRMYILPIPFSPKGESQAKHFYY